MPNPEAVFVTLDGHRQLGVGESRALVQIKERNYINKGAEIEGILIVSLKLEC